MKYQHSFMCTEVKYTLYPLEFNDLIHSQKIVWNIINVKIITLFITLDNILL